MTAPAPGASPEVPDWVAEIAEHAVESLSIERCPHEKRTEQWECLTCVEAEVGAAICRALTAAPTSSEGASPAPEELSFRVRDVLSELADRAHLSADEPLGKRWLAAMDLLERLAAAPPLPGWTSEPPAVPGYYWLDREGRDGGIAWCDTRGAWCPDFHTFSELHVRTFAGPLEAPPPRASAGEREDRCGGDGWSPSSGDGAPRRCPGCPDCAGAKP